MRLIPFIRCLLLLSLAWASIAAASDVKVESHLRPGGYFVGDVINESIMIQGPAGAVLAEDSLPRSGEGQWVELRDMKVVSANPEQGHYTLRLTWQIFKAVRETRNIAIPGFSATMHLGKEALSVNVHERQVMVSQLLPIMLDPIAATLQADALPPKISLVVMLRAMSFAIPIFIITSLWLLWRYDMRPFRWLRGGPFTQACRLLTRIRSRKIENAEAFAIAHHALNASAGGAVFAGDIGKLLQSKPALAVMKDEIAEFYRQSNLLFFASDQVTWDVTMVRKFCLKGRAIERGRKP
ncbi:hypothetical protein A7981_10935 [Methylovorus sp. MM2]|uniref:hypothetical protein n=1 Tax=Methylovorus sp. MM2 TaxID=1848038 RepID=UPI0007E28EF7|nr:hypothetical protein [Methylovorus sp. MM2]OAM51242.1 hypothetical protein A7981_10935 [Methylovorus sp. MM2]